MQLSASASTAESFDNNGGAEDDTDNETAAASSSSDQDQSVPAATFNLIKAICGSGVLTLPYGVAVTSNARQAAIPASIFLIVLGGLSAYSFYLIGRLCHEGQARSMGELWDQEVGPDTSWIISATIVAFTMGAALSFSIVLGDTFGSLAKSVGVKGFLASRHASILGITTFALYPLCRLSSLAALAPASVVGVVGTVITCLFMASRCLSPSSPYSLPDGSFLATLPESHLPLFGTRMRVFSPSSLILVAMSCVAFLAHYAAPDFYHSLPKSDRVLTKFRNVTILGFSVVTLINVAVLSFGFLTFGGNCAGIVLNNYSTMDLGASICRMLMGLSVIGSFPFLISSSKSAFLKLCGTESSKRIQSRVTQSMVAIVTGLALLLEDAGFVVSLIGALGGSAIIYIFPPFLYLRATQRRLREGSIQVTRKLRLERFVSRFLAVFGVVSGLVAGAVTILNTYFPSLLQ